MSSVLDRLRLGTMSSTRLVMVGAVLGAVVALAAVVVLSPTSTEETANGPNGALPGGGGPPAKTDHDIRYAFAAPVGTCLNWQSSDGSDMRQVNCAQAHIFEVTEVIDISDDYPADAKLPSADEWAEVAKKRCKKGAATYLDKPLDPHGKLKVSALRPNDADWGRGTRDLRCGLWRTGPGGSPQAIKGPAVEQDQSDIWAKGTCLAIKDKTVGDPVKCSEKHSYEMIAVLDLSKEFGEDYPSEKEQDTWLDKRCAKEVKKYTGGEKLAKKLAVTWDKRSKSSWRAGSYLVNCKVGAALADGSGLASVTGSIKAEKDSDKTSKKPDPTSKTSDKSTKPTR